MKKDTTIKTEVHWSCNADCPDVEYGNCCHPNCCQKKLVQPTSDIGNLALEWSPVETERSSQEKKMREIFPNYETDQPDWQRLNFFLEAMDFGGWILGEFWAKRLINQPDCWYHNNKKVSIIDLHKNWLPTSSQTIAKPNVSGRFSDDDVINVITAWESLKGNRNYSPKDIENWLRDYMSPAINRLRAVLNGN